MDSASYFDSPIEAKPKAITPVSVIIACALLLLAIGIPIVYSASTASKHGAATFVTKQLIGVGFGVCVAFFVSRLDLEHLRKYAVPLLVVAVILLLLTLVPGIGIRRNGSSRWLGVPSLAFQTSEFAKIALIFCLAHYLAIKQNHIGKTLQGYGVPLLMIAAITLPISQQKDIGTACLIFGVGISILFLAGARIVKHLVPTFIAGIAAAAVLVATSPNRLARLTAWINHETTKSGDGGWQLEQALSAFAVGGIHGTGLGQGRQQITFLPEAHTDFICAVIGEELGLIGTISVFALFLIIFIAALMHLRRAPNMFQYLLTAGTVLFLIMPALVNFYVVTGMAPTKGMSLPLVSYGMSNLLLTGALIGILLNNQRNWPRPAFSKRERILREVVQT
ncbi:cell division protein FtsW [Ereboglobus sp. PH5-10]|uniref:FtsW/RodA/SpoVE family cell cycle protein n=1 Tax=Ereboglobus sp. PH5-10 TaxID=2940629 RepID=UPI0024052CEF|nr:putative peptidoglycan glycosyltransferase FtsW [Ereboglobus sp. PH5-10]MDF9826006.1 cell division protein FtsW [Ereboglobus sp. PH5-10]